MEDEQHWWAPGLGAAVILILVGSLALVAAFGAEWFKAFLTGQAAGWAQALGAVAAIGIAYRMGRIQIHADRVLEAERRAKDDLRRILIIDTLLSNAEGLCNAYKDSWDRRQGVPVSGPIATYWQDCRAGIAGINPFDSPSSEIVVYLAQLPRQIDQLIEAHNDLVDAFMRTVGHKDFGESFRCLKQQLDDALVMLGEARTECGNASQKIVAIWRKEASLHQAASRP